MGVSGLNAKNIAPELTYDVTDLGVLSPGYKRTLREKDWLEDPIMYPFTVDNADGVRARFNLYNLQSDWYLLIYKETSKGLIYLRSGTNGGLKDESIVQFLPPGKYAAVVEFYVPIGYKLSTTYDLFVSGTVPLRDDDVLHGSDADDIYNGGKGNDFITGRKGDDRLFGGIGDDYLEGGTGNDYLKGTNGDDVLNGGEGNDLIDGGFGVDILTGGEDSDRFVYSNLKESGQGAQSRDVITDFSSSEDDKIDLSAIAEDAVFIGSSDFTGTKPEIRFDDGILQFSTPEFYTPIFKFYEPDSAPTPVFEIELLGNNTFGFEDLLL